MNFVDEQNDVTASFDFFQHFLQALFEVSAVTATCNKCSKVECVQLLASQCFWHVVAHDLLCKTFDDRCLTNTWLTNEDWVVLGATRKNLHDAFHFALTTNYWVELVVFCQLREVATELIKNLTATFFLWLVFCSSRCTFCFSRRTLITRQQLNNLLTNTTEVGSKLDQYLSGYAFAFANKPKQNVFSADVVVAKLQCFAQREFENFLGTWSKWNVTRW